MSHNSLSNIRARSNLVCAKGRRPLARNGVPDERPRLGECPDALDAEFPP